MRLPRLLLLFALLCGALGLAAPTRADAGCPHGTASGAPAEAVAAQPHDSAEARVPAAAAAADRQLHPRAGAQAFTPVAHLPGTPAPAGPACCSGAGCLMACHWLMAAPELAAAPTGPGRRLAFVLAGEMTGRAAEVPLPPPRPRA